MPPLVPTIAGRFRCTCERCAAFHELEAADLDAGWRSFKALGWLDLARKGKGRAAYPWWCPACAPKRSGSMGRSTI